VVTFALDAALAWALAALLHWWPRLPGAWRRRTSILTGAAGLAFLVAAIESEGLRESATTAAVVVVGPASVTARSSASASLYYYVLTAVCLLLGFAGLAFGDRLSRWLSRRWLLSATAVAYLVTVVRFLLEKSAAPLPLVQSVGVTWMAPVAGAFIAVCLRDEGRGRADLLRSLVAYALLVRGFVAAVAVAATRLHLGSHYDISPLTEVPLALTGHVYTFVPGSWVQISWLALLPQLAAWPVFTVTVGFLAGLLTWRIPPGRGTTRAVASTPPRAIEADGRS
jgi:hypothetical protein